MKKGIHPKYGKSSAKCACGEIFETGSTEESIHVEVCSKCHSFFTTGKRKLTDTRGRVSKYMEKYGKPAEE